MRRTRWFSKDIRPVNHGWYECKYGEIAPVEMRFFNGTWRCFPDEPDAYCSFNFYPNAVWRGLTEPAKEKK